MSRVIEITARRPGMRHIAASWTRHWQPGWPHQLERALRHPIAGPLIRAGAWRIARAEWARAAANPPPAEPARITNLHEWALAGRAADVQPTEV